MAKNLSLNFHNNVYYEEIMLLFILATLAHNNPHAGHILTRFYINFRIWLAGKYKKGHEQSLLQLEYYRLYTYL